MSINSTFTRRSILGMTAGLGTAAVLGGCAGSENGASETKGGTVTSLVMGVEPAGWPDVLAKVNEKLKAEHDLTLDVQFINNSKYGEQSLLKFTAGDRFDTALEALWLHMAKLQQDGALTDLTGKIDEYENLKASLPAELIESNTWDGHLWGIPQATTAGRLQMFVIRQDLAEKYGFDDLAFPNTPDFDRVEQFLYTVKEKGDGVIPFGAWSGLGAGMTIPDWSPPLFNAANWADPHASVVRFSGARFICARDAAETKASSPIPFWEDEGFVETLHRVKKYYEDGIINKDALNADKPTIDGLWASGKYAATRIISGGTVSTVLPALQKAVPGANVAMMAPLKGLDAKPNQSFMSDNNVVVPAQGGNLENAMALQDWLSIQENHDLVSYGIPGKDWEAVGDGHLKKLSKYSFPGYSLCWRIERERYVHDQVESEAAVLEWSQNYDNFTRDTFYSFIPDPSPVSHQLAQLSAVMAEHAGPLFFGVVDIQTGLDKLKKAAEGAGFDEIQAEFEKQANAYLSKL